MAHSTLELNEVCELKRRTFERFSNLNRFEKVIVVVNNMCGITDMNALMSHLMVLYEILQRG
jgi:hypothetical protein